jgi:hypothetical protein
MRPHHHAHIVWKPGAGASCRAAATYNLLLLLLLLRLLRIMSSTVVAGNSTASVVDGGGFDGVLVAVIVQCSLRCKACCRLLQRVVTEAERVALQWSNMTDSGSR